MSEHLEERHGIAIHLTRGRRMTDDGLRRNMEALASGVLLAAESTRDQAEADKWPSVPGQSAVYRILANAFSDTWTALALLADRDGSGIGAYLVMVRDAQRATIEGQVLAGILVAELVGGIGFRLAVSPRLEDSDLDAFTNAVRNDLERACPEGRGLLRIDKGGKA